jgi:hypothetical protein
MIRWHRRWHRKTASQVPADECTNLGQVVQIFWHRLVYSISATSIIRKMPPSLCKTSSGLLNITGTFSVL